MLNAMNKEERNEVGKKYDRESINIHKGGPGENRMNKRHKRVE